MLDAPRTAPPKAPALPLAVLAALLALAPRASADSWEALPHDPDGEVVVTDFLVAQDSDLLGVHAFSAAAREWVTLAAPGGELEGAGAFCALVRAPGALVAFSARRNAVATLPVPGGTSVDALGVGDDVALAVLSNGGGTTAFAFSARVGGWTALQLAGPVRATAVGGSVCGVSVGATTFGFAARTGTWSAYTAPFAGAALVADGNTLLVDNASTGGPVRTVAAFSGVRACWRVSPAAAPGTTAVLDRDLTAVVTDPGLPGGDLAVAAWSARRAKWVLGAEVHPSAPDLVTSAGVCAVLGPDGELVAAFGAGHASWAAPPAPLPAGTFRLGADLLVGCDPAADELVGFSALVGGGFATRSKLPGAAGATIGGARLGLVDLGTVLHAYLPRKNAFAAPLAVPPGAVRLPSDAVAHAVASEALAHAIATRGGTWIAYGATLPNGDVGSSVAVGGTVIAHQSSTGAVVVFDERCSEWSAPFQQGAVHTHLAGAALVLALPNGPTGTLRAYSAPRGEWLAPSGPFPAPGPLTEPRVGAHAACAVDAGGLLWAFGATNDTHTFDAWPDGSAEGADYGVAGAVGPTCAGDTATVGVRGAPGEASLVLFAPALDCRPASVPPIAGELWLPLQATGILAVLGVHDADGQLELPLGLGGLAPAGAGGVWFQGLTVEPVGPALRFAARRSAFAPLF